MHLGEADGLPVGGVESLALAVGKCPGVEGIVRGQRTQSGMGDEGAGVVIGTVAAEVGRHLQPIVSGGRGADASAWC